MAGVDPVVDPVGMQVGEVQQQERTGALSDLGEELGFAEVRVRPVQRRGGMLERERDGQFG